MKKEMISIIVPIYNAEKYIEKCLNSLINQTKKELEFILVNDGSTDNTESIIKKYKDKRIKYFKNKNQGIGKTRNFGIKKATGEYLMFIDSDDYLELNACEELYKKAKKENSDLVICDFYKIYENGKLEEIKLPSFKTTTLKDNPNILIDVNLGPCNKLYKTKLIKENNISFIENLKYEDAPFVAETLDRAKKISKVNKCLNYYVIHGNSETTVRDERTFDILKIIDIIRNYFQGKEYIEPTLKKLIVKILTNYNIQQRNQKDIKIGMNFIDESFNYLKTYVPNYKDNSYYPNRSFFKKTIEKNKLFSKIYCYLYHLKTNKNIGSYSKFLINLLYIVMTLIFSYLLFNIIFHNNHFLINIKPVNLILSSIIYLLVAYYLNKLLNKYIKKDKKYVIISFILLIIFQLLFAYIFAVTPSWDFGGVYHAAISNIRGEVTFNNYNYFYIYPNNLAYGLLLSAIFYPIKLLGLDNFLIYGIVGILINILCIDISLLILFKIIREYFKKENHKIFWLLSIICTPFITYVPIFYTDTLSLPFIIGGVYFLLKIINDTTQKSNLILSGILLGIAYCLKPTAIIIIIAFIIFYLILINKKRLITRLLTITIVLITFIIPILSLNIYKQVYFDQAKLEKTSFPLTHWLMMGLTGNGGYNQEDVDYTASYIGLENKKEANLKIIKERLQNLEKENELFDFYTNKALYVWGDGTYYSIAKLNVNPIRENKIKDYILNSEKNKLFILFSESQLVLTLLFIILGMLFKKYLTDKQQTLQVFLNIIVFGIFLFELLWEARSRYLVNMIPILLLSCYLGISAVTKFIKSRKVEE